jgi:transglutaminase-like putative cysteine protease
MLAAKRKSLSAGLISENEPTLWLGNTPLLDLADDRLRMRAKALTQLGKSHRERALAVYAFVKAIRYGYPTGASFPTARQVIDARSAGNFAKSTLFVALLRLAEVPARVRIVQLRGDILRGYYDGQTPVNHALTEVWLHDRWVRTDSYTFDASYMALARARLTGLGWDRGYYVLHDGHPLWDGKHDSFSAFSATDAESMPLADLGVFNDPLEFAKALKKQNGHASVLLKGLQLRMAIRLLNRGILQLRAEGGPAQTATV